MMKEFRPAFLFLSKFLALYICGNLLYGIWVESYKNGPDDFTIRVSSQTNTLLRAAGFQSSAVVNVTTRTVSLKEDDDVVLNVYEGCNGVNVIIVFTGFIFAFGGSWRAMSWFLPLGIGIIHVANLSRLWLLYYTAIFKPHYFYYFHKYFFTAILYVIVFILWVIWVIIVHDKNRIQMAATYVDKR